MIAEPFLRAIRRFAPSPSHPPSRWVLVLYDQLRPAHPLLVDGEPADTGVVYIETTAKPARRAYHAKKLTLLLSAMRHDARDVGAIGPGRVACNPGREGATPSPRPRARPCSPDDAG